MDNELKEFLDGKFGFIEKKFEQMDQRLDKMDQRLDKVDKRFDSMDQRLDKIEVRLTNLEDGQIQIKEKLNAVYEQTAVLTEFKTEVNLKLDEIIDDNKSIHGIVGDHEVAIRTLRRRPV